MKLTNASPPAESTGLNQNGTSFFQWKCPHTFRADPHWHNYGLMYAEYISYCWAKEFPELRLKKTSLQISLMSDSLT